MLQESTVSTRLNHAGYSCRFIFRAAGAYAEAIHLYEQALSHAPGDVRLYNNCAIAKLNLEK
jgi:hypothetical protein